jgi:protein O-mannosyl-transferase
LLNLKILSTNKNGPSASWALAILAALISAAYLPSLTFSFQFDDWNVIVFEKRVQSLAAWWQSMPGIRPLTKFSYALNHQFAAEVGGFRVSNLLIHLLASLGAFVLFVKLLSRCGWHEMHAKYAALGIAVVFALHPAQTEAVTYISGRSGSLCAMFILWSLALWLPVGTAQPQRWRSAVSAALFGSALLAKETALVLPLALLLINCLRGNGKLTGRAAFHRSALHWGIAVVALGIILNWPPYRRLILTSLDTRSIGENLLTQANAVGYLLGQLFHWERLNADPRLPIITTVSALNLAKALALACVLIAGIWLMLKRHYWVFGVLWFLLWLAPTNSLLARLEVANDRQLYLPILGVAWVAAFLVRYMWLRFAVGTERLWALRSTTALAAIILVAAMTCGVWSRNDVYATEQAYWQDVLAKTPQNARAANNLGYVLLIQCKLPEAQRLLERAVQLDASYTKAQVNLRLLREGVYPVSGKDCPPH